MNNSTLVKLRVDAEYCSFRTVSRDDQGKRQVFYGLRDQFLALQQKSEVVMKDGSNFTVFRANRNRNTLTIMFYWLSTNIEGYVTGKTQQVILPDTGYTCLSQVNVAAIAVSYADNSAGGRTVTIGSAA